jgi:hypothetical protein
MTITLNIAVEAHWRGTILDVVNPIAALTLKADPDIADLFTIGQPYPLTLTDGNQVRVWCARTATGRFVLEISSVNQILSRAEADAPISMSVKLSDGKQYEISTRIGP